MAVMMALAAVAPSRAAEPFDAAALAMEGQIALAEGNLQKAEAVFTRGIGRPAVPDRMRISYYLGRAHVFALQRRYDEALADADRAVTLSDAAQPSMARGRVHATRGLLRAEAGHSAAAVADLETALALMQAPDEEYVQMLAAMERTRPDQALSLRQQTEMVLVTVRERLAALRAGR